METKSIGFIGGGRITKIFLQGFKNKNVEFPSIHVFDTNKDTLHELKKNFPEIEISGSQAEVAEKDIVFIALHPPVIKESIPELSGRIGDKALVVSLAPKFTIEKLSALLNTKRIMRIIPNATSFINQGYNPVCFSSVIENSEKASILETLKVLGETFETDESKLEAYAIVSAMLPTYFWFQWKEMENIAKEIGLTDKESKETVFETLKASLELMYNSNLNYETVTDLIPVKPIAEKETDIKGILNGNLVALFNKIKP